MADVLITHSNHLWSDRKQIEKMQPYPPLQTMLAAACLRTNGIATALFDPTLVPADDSVIERFEEALDVHRPRMVVVCEDDFNFLSKMCLMRNRELAFEIAAVACRRGIDVVVHGSDASDHLAEYLTAGFSCVLLGEVEATLLEVVGGGQRSRIRGLVFRDSGTVRYTAPREPSADLDSLPLPAWDLIDIDLYRAAWVARHGYFSLNIASSRGCPYHCNWCAKPIYGQSYHCRSAAAVAAEMQYIKREFQPDNIWFADDIFALSPRWTREFADAVSKLGARIPFRMQSRCDLMTRETVGALREAGCAEVWMGAESGSQKILDAMDKGTRVEQIHRACENLKRHGIRVGLFLQFGYAGEKWEDIEATIRMVRETQPADVGISVSYPLPGTKFHELVGIQLGPVANWSDSADLAMMFRGTYSTDFYRALADAVHREVRAGGDVERAWSRVYELEPRSLSGGALNAEVLAR
jgi:anaerobic magnesium-protoporphyrin IX monomethyl ester cyclase